MFKTKSEVDKHVGKLFLKAKSDSEKNRECFKIARLYFGIKEYKYAKQYLASYLSEISDDPNAWKLMAEIAELDDSNWQKAIDCYIKYYENNQTDSKILLKIVSCYLKLDRYDSNAASKWLSKAESFFPYDKQVIEFKEKLFTTLELASTQSNSWEVFLLKGLSQNYYNEDLHYKLVKMYLKNDNLFFNAIKHLLVIEQKSLLVSSSTWYKSIIELIETCSYFILNDPKFAEKYELINLVYLIINYHHILTSLQESSYEEMIKLFIKFDTNLYRFETYLINKQTENTFGLSSPYQLLILDEIKSHYHYICGLYILKTSANQAQIVNLRPCTPASDDTDDSTSAQLENYDHLNRNLLACVCMANSSLFSKPNNKQIFTNNIDKLKSKENSSELQACVLNIFMLAYRDANWRYSNSGNWLKFQMNKTNDEIKFLKSIKKFSKISNIRQTIVDTIGLNRQNLKESFILDSNNFQFQIDKEKFYVMDHLSLDYADKYCLENQSFNLKYLVWYTLINAQLNNKSLDEFLPNFSIRGLKFGVDNLNICNLESLSQIDLKLFLYSVSFQTMSELNKTNGYKLEPYWLQANLCTKRQSDWWFDAYNYLVNRDNKVVTQDFSLDNLNNSGYLFSLDSKKQTELAKILELVRLKHGQIKLIHNSKQEKYKINIRICIKIVKYFQYLIDHLNLLKASSIRSPNKGDSHQFSSSLSNQSIYFPVDCELEYSPQEKLDYLKAITAHYWSYVTQQLVKLKQLKNLDETYDDVASSTVIADHAPMTSYNESINNQSKLNSPAFEYQFYFDYTEPEFIKPETNTPSLDSYDLCGDDESIKNEEIIKQKLSLAINDLDDLLIQTGLLNLILYKVDPSSESTDSKSIKEAVSLTSQLNISDLTSSQLTICKRINDCLNELKKQEDKYSCSMQDINVLIEFNEKKLKIKHFTASPIAVAPQPVPLVINQSDLNSTIENETQEISVKEEPQEKVVSKLESPKPIIKQVEQVSVKLEEILKKEKSPIKATSLPIHPLIVPTKVEHTPEQATLAAPIQIEVLEQQTVKSPKPVETSYHKGRSEKTQSLIETLKEQCMPKIEFNYKYLESQFSNIRDLQKRINNEINQLKKCTTRRRDNLNEFRTIVKNFDSLIDMDTFNRQFNVFYWLFQQQPNIGQFFIDQNKKFFEQMNKPNDHQSVKSAEAKKEPAAPLPNLSFTNTTFSQNEYCTPKQDRSQMSMFVKPSLNTPQTFLQKPIGEIKFGVNPIDMIERLKDSANKFKQQEANLEDYNHEDEGGEDDGEDYDEEYDGDEDYDDDNEEDDEDEEEYEQDEDQMIAGNLNQSNKHETFLSCNEAEPTGYFTHIGNNSTDESKSLNKSSIECLFDNHAIYYEFNGQQWLQIGRANFQIIADDGVSQRGHFQAHLICNLIDQNKSNKYDLTEYALFNPIPNVPFSLSWSFNARTSGLKFEHDCIQEVKNILNECQLRIKRNSRNDSFSSSCSQNNLLRKEIGFHLNETQVQFVTLNASKSLLNQYMISILHDSNLLFQHVLRKDQKFETSEKVKQQQYICQYSIDRSLIQTNSFNMVNLDNLNQINIKLIFQTKLDLNDFLNLFKN